MDHSNARSKSASPLRSGQPAVAPVRRSFAKILTGMSRSVRRSDFAKSERSMHPPRVARCAHLIIEGKFCIFKAKTPVLGRVSTGTPDQALWTPPVHLQYMEMQILYLCMLGVKSAETRWRTLRFRYRRRNLTLASRKQVLERGKLTRDLTVGIQITKAGDWSASRQHWSALLAYRDELKILKVSQHRLADKCAEPHP